MARSVLILDNNIARREELAALLEDEGFEVATESEAEWAMGQLQKQQFDAVILRGEQPDLAASRPLVEELREGKAGRDIPVVAVGDPYAKALEGAARGALLYSLAESAAAVEVVRALKDILGIAVESEKEKEITPVLPFDEERFADRDSQLEKEEVDREASRALANEQLASGSLGETPFCEVLAELFLSGLSGALVLRKAERCKIVYLRLGHVETLKSNALSECLGRILVREKMISEEECEESLRRMAASRRKQGTILVEMGCISPHNLAYAINKQLEEKLFDLFAWTEGEFVFDPESEIPAGTATIELKRPVVIAKGIRQYMNISTVALAMDPFMLTRLVAGENALCEPQEVFLDEADEELYKAVRGGQTITQLLDDDPVEKARQLRLFYTLKATGNLVQQDLAAEAEQPEEEAAAGEEEEVVEEEVVETEQVVTEEIPLPELKALKKHAPSPDAQLLAELKSRLEALKQRDYFEILGVPREANTEQIKRAYIEMAKAHHPEKHFRTAPLAVRAVAEEIFGLINTAHEMLSDARERQKYLKKLTGLVKREISKDLSQLLVAEGRFQEGEGHMRRGKYEAAYRCFKDASDLFPAEPEYRAYLGYSLFKCAPDARDNVDAALQMLKMSIDANPHIDKSYLFLGLIYKRIGKADLAEENFKSALRINPDCMKLLGRLGGELSGKGHT